jgi:hypothetical protein
LQRRENPFFLLTIKQENKMLKTIMGSILLAVLLIACTSGDWKYVPCNGTNTECGNLDGNKRNNG